jgi:hypothetical protein
MVAHQYGCPKRVKGEGPKASDYTNYGDDVMIYGSGDTSPASDSSSSDCE